MKNYREIMELARTYPQLKEEVKEIEDMQAQGFNVKNNIESIKDILTKIMKNSGNTK